jgi:hypothetical protein
MERLDTLSFSHRIKSPAPSHGLFFEHASARQLGPNRVHRSIRGARQSRA